MRPGNSGFQKFEALGHHERRVVWQHHAAGADTDALGHGCDLPDHNLRGTAGDRWKVMVFGNPEARKAEAIRVPREIEGVSQCGRWRRACHHERKIQY